MVAQQIAFGVTAFAMALGAVRVVTTKNVVHAALWLMLVLAGVAANFILLAAEFVAVVQVLVYIGAIVVLFLFGIMLTRAPIGRESGLDEPLVRSGMRAEQSYVGKDVGGRSTGRVETVEQRLGHAEHRVVVHEPTEHRNPRRFAVGRVGT